MINKDNINALIGALRKSESFIFSRGDKCVAAHAYRLWNHSPSFDHDPHFLAEKLGITTQQASTLIYSEINKPESWQKISKQMAIEALERLRDTGLIYYHPRPEPIAVPKRDNALVRKLQAELKQRREVLARRKKESDTAQKVVDDLEEILTKIGEMP